VISVSPTKIVGIYAQEGRSWPEVGLAGKVIYLSMVQLMMESYGLVRWQRLKVAYELIERVI